ncbi:hypothetical protein Patl1_29244 [Pistacia atlantica]|uniref:Uncharacterized protein n=1 Tax=Pistacia atlantica TaxID=434234 RepID=A0ACC1BG33_9ROSI|nr:hypothetical protein Patl1_29244 [Pistacia atlantica]
MLFNFDKLVSCDRLADCILCLYSEVNWDLLIYLDSGLLAFHQALVNNPQDAFVIWVFVSVLYNGKWEEVVKIARERAKDQVNFAPEISGFLELNQMKNLSELASLVQDCVNALNETHTGITKKQKLVVKKCRLSEQDLTINKHKVVPKEERQQKGKKHKKVVETCQLCTEEITMTQGNLAEKKDCHSSLEEVIAMKINKHENMFKENSNRLPLSSDCFCLLYNVR